MNMLNNDTLKHLKNKLKGLKIPEKYHDDVVLYCVAIELGNPGAVTIEKFRNDILKRLYSSGLVIRGRHGLQVVYVDEKDKFTTDHVKIIRELFSKEKTGVAGKMGSTNGIITRLNYFFNNNPEATIEEVIRSCRYYAENYKEITNYLQRADYFIAKNIGRADETSNLESVFEEGKDYEGKSNAEFQKLI